MSDLTDALKDSPRLLMEARLSPRQGSRFQPTGFPDLGPARYKSSSKDGLTEMLLVESPQSIANWLEAMTWEPPQLGRMSSATAKLAPPLVGMPYIQVNNSDNTPLTNSIIEAHRLNSPYILEGQDTRMKDILKTEVGTEEGRPVNIPKLASVVFRYDPNSVLHGVFFAKKGAEEGLAGGRMRLSRLISGFIEALGVKDAAHGGVKIDQINPSGDTKQGFGHVPFHRTDFTGNLAVYFNFDLALLRGYGLGDAAETFLIALALFKIERFLQHGMRLRTACDLKVDGELVVTMPETGFERPDSAKLVSLLTSSLAACKKQFKWADDPVTKLVYEKKAAKAPKATVTEIELPADLKLPNAFPESLTSQVELKKGRHKKLLIKGLLTPELADEIKKQFSNPAPVEELLRKKLEETTAEEVDEDDGSAD